MSRRNRKILTWVGCGAAVAFVAFGAVTLRLYQQRRASDAQIAARWGSAALEDGADGAGNVPEAGAGAPPEGATAKTGETQNELQQNANSGNTNENSSEKKTKQSEEVLLNQNEVEYNGGKYLRNTYVKAYLLIGVDRKGKLTEATVTGQGGQADGVVLAVHDTASNQVSIVQIPRDTMTPITLTDLSGNVLGKDVQHLTLAFAYGDGQAQSCQYMVDATSELLCGLPIDGYFAATIDVISMLNDMVGGVPVTITEDYLQAVDPAFVPGQTILLKGNLAERYVRYRDITVAQSTITRMERQRKYMIAFEAQLQQAAAKDSNLVPKMFSTIQDYSLTNMDKGTYLRLGMDLANGQKIGTDSFYFLPGTTGSGEFLTDQGEHYDEYYPDQSQIRELLLGLFYRKAE